MSRPLAIVLVFLLAWSTQTATQSQKPSVRKPFHTESRQAATSLDDLWARSDVVVEGVIESDQRADYEVQGSELIHTLYDVRVDAVYKGSSSLREPGVRIQVRRRGGIREHADRFEVHEPEGFPLFHRGQRLIMFLRETEWKGSVPYRGRFYYGTTYDGPDSFYQIIENEVGTSARSSAARAIITSTPAQLRATLRRKGGAR